MTPQPTYSIISNNVRRIGLLGANPGYTGKHLDGTTIQFEIGQLKNPMSLKTSGFFYLETFTTEDGNKNIINRSFNQIQITN